MRAPQPIAALVLSAVLSGCAIVHPGVEVRGAAPALAGVWEGTYESPDTGRHGGVFLSLSARGDSAVGEVVMTLPDDPANVQYDGERWVRDGPVPPSVLAVAFVRVGSDRVRGLLEPYQDPTCGCELRTTFEGVVDGDRVAGTFVSIHSDTPHQTAGTWQATRQLSTDVHLGDSLQPQ